MKVHAKVILLALIAALTIQLQDIQDVIIIGAGISGLRASQILSQQQITHLILESTDHIGGRITQMDFQGLKVDKGASFIHGSKNEDNPLGKMVEDLGWSCIDGTCSYCIMYFQDEKEGSIPYTHIFQAKKIYSKLTYKILNELQKKKDVSLAQATEGLFEKYYPQQSQVKKKIVDFMFKIQANIDGSQTSLISAKMRSYRETKNDIMPATGFHRLFKAIFNNMGDKVLFNHRVHSIDYSSNIVKVQTNNGVFYAKKVMSSLPLGVLKAEIVKFIPSLPKVYQRSINNIGFGYADKLFVSFKKRFWDSKRVWLSFVTNSSQNNYPVAFILPSDDEFLLIFFVSSQHSLKISKLTDQEIIENLQGFLKLFFRPSQIQIKAVKLTKWHMDENTLGSYSFYKVGTEDKDFRQLSKPILNKLWFIGQHTHPELNSYAHGAYLSGEFAALQVVSSLKTESQPIQPND